MRPNAATLAVLLAVVALGLALAFVGSSPPTVEERWRALGVPEPRVEFIGDFTDAERAAIVGALKDVQAFYAERFGAVDSDFTAYFGDDLDALNATLAEVRGNDWLIPFDCGGITAAKAIFIILQGCGDATRERGGPIAHEYFHVLQQYLGLVVGTGPRWMHEGSAVYAAALHAEGRGRGRLETAREGGRLTWRALAQPLPGRYAPNDLPRFSYDIGFLAVDWLVRERGPEALAEYYRLGGGWSEFRTGFGMAWEEFLDVFEEHRLDVAPPFPWRIEGTVAGPDEEPVQAILVVARVWLPDDPEWQFWAGEAYTRWDGKFAFTGPGSGYALGLILTCPGGSRSYGPWADIGEWGADGFTADGATPFAGAERDRTDLVITLPETPEALAARHCDER